MYCKYSIPSNVEFFLESGFMARYRGCVPSGEPSVDAVAVTRHQCALLCLSSVDCEKYDYHFASSPPVCKLYSTSCRLYVLIDVHSYDKGMFIIPGYI